MMHSDDDIIGLINLGNPTEFTVKQLAQMVIEQTGTVAGISYLPLPQDDPVRRKQDVGRARELLCSEPTIQLEEDLARTIEYFRSEIESNLLARVESEAVAPG